MTDEQLFTAMVGPFRFEHAVNRHEAMSKTVVQNPYESPNFERIAALLAKMNVDYMKAVKNELAWNKRKSQ